MMYGDIKFGTYESSAVEVDKLELASRVGAGISYSSEQLDIALEKVKKAIDFKYAYVTVPVSLKEDICDFGFAKCKSNALSRMLNGCEGAILLCVTAGLEIDRLILKAELISKADAFFIDACASAYIEAFCDKISKDICKDKDVTGRFSPGYSDLPLSFQVPLLERLNAQRTVGVALNKSLLMTPMKSITAIIGRYK